MLGSRILCLGTATTRSTLISRPLHLPSQEASQCFRKRFTSESKQSPNQAEEQLEKLECDLKSDAYIRMLATPLRKCAITQLILPKALMFRMISQSIQGEEDSILDKSIPIKEAKKGKVVHKRRSLRYTLKEVRKTKQKALLRAQRLLLHKVVTSITPQSRDRFSKQLIQVREQLEALEKPRSGILMPFGLTRESARQFRGFAQGRGIWCTLNKKIAADVPDKNIHKLLPFTSPLPRTFSDLLQEGLEKRVVEEAQLLLRRITSNSYNSDDRYSWLIRRLVGSEMRAIVHDGRIELRDRKTPRLACLIVKEGEMPILQQGIDVYNLQSLFNDDKRRIEVKKAFQSIAIFLNRNQLREQRRKKVPKEESTKPDISSEAQTKIDDSITQQGIKWPRILAVKRDERSVDLCIALWRLEAWCRSE